MPTVEEDGLTLRYAVRGDGPLVVLVPDAVVGPWMWAWVLEDLAGPFRVVTYALRGTDGSDPADDGEDGGYTVPVQVTDLEAVVSAMPARRVHLVGCGLGGQIALTYAATHDHVKTLTLVGTGPAPTLDPADRETLCAADPITSLGPYLGDALDRLDHEQLRAWRETDDPDPAVRSRQLAAAAAVDLPPLHEVTLPTRLLHGDRDRVWSLDGARTLTEGLPRGHLETVQDGPHLLPVATPRVVADEISGLLEDAGFGVS